MGLLGKFRGRRGDEDEDKGDLDVDDEARDDDDSSSTGLIGRMRQKLKRSSDGAGDDDDDLNDSLDDGGGSPGMFGRIRRKFKPGNNDEDDDDEPGLAAENIAGAGDTPAIPVTVTPPPTDASASVGGDDNKPAQAPGGTPAQGGNPTAVYIVDGPESGGASPDATGSEEGWNEPKQDGAEKAGSGEAGDSGMNLADIFETEEEVDEAFQDLVDSVGEIAASDLATQLQDLMASLDKGR
ncbi:MAG: hypothetical protein BZY88_16425 [SAR202 cluster bacterium Io17-Chloro-G9]|nr:MAG: hypothetical protein BZY88_16425 [SAR202 cluster bacterium Io17-Chloro-G9]